MVVHVGTNFLGSLHHIDEHIRVANLANPLSYTKKMLKKKSFFLKDYFKRLWIQISYWRMCQSTQNT